MSLKSLRFDLSCRPEIVQDKKELIILELGHNIEEILNKM
jgi:hypothetical protein